ncbi:glycosyl transferase family 11 [Pedobacter glucosidilyticus]|nr:alpha-1,2-fucosyltransferase [Pedobacter glucosidilyticus]KHJ39622.1 glycosyl transferase family 11 [Pedobacter glucosidilyticus]
MIVVKIMGGIGNQLFQYAVGRQLALKNQTELKLDLSSFDNLNHRPFRLNIFDISIIKAKKEDIPYVIRTPTPYKLKLIVNLLSVSKLKLYREKHFNFDPEVLDLTNNFYLYGYWQCEKYFSSIKDIIIKDLKFNKEINSNLKKLSGLIQNSDSISLHVRRGDYVGNEHHNVLSIEYYIKAIDIITLNLENPIIFIFSDDIEWCTNNLKINFPHYFISGNEDWEDLKLMTLCNHNILANSSFSWWGAYLGTYKNKKVIGPKKWLTDKNGYITSDILPEKWLKI